MTLRSGNRCDSCHRAVRNCSARPPFTPGTAELCSGRRRYACYARFILRAPCAPSRRLHQDSAALRAAVAPAPRARLYAVCRGTFQAAEAALRQQPAASAVSLVGSFICQKQGGDRGNCTSGQQSSSNRCDSSRCTVRRCFARAICPRNRRVVQR